MSRVRGSLDQGAATTLGTAQSPERVTGDTQQPRQQLIRNLGTRPRGRADVLALGGATRSRLSHTAFGEHVGELVAAAIRGVRLRRTL